MGIINRDGALFMATGIDNSGLYSGLNQAENRIDQFGNHISSMGDKIAKLTGIGLGVAGLKAFGQEIINVRGEMQMLESSFEVLLGGKGVPGFLTEIKKFAVDSPLSLTGVSNAAQTLLGFNIEAEKVIPTIKQIGDISMGNEQRFNSLILAFSQMSSTGKLMGQDLNQMINAGFNPLQEISAKTGKSISELKKEMESGAISSQMVADAFASVTAEGGKFYGMTQKQAEGIKGLQAQLEGGLQDAFNDIGKSQEGLIAGGYKVAISLVENYEKVGETVSVLIATYGAYRAAVALNVAMEKGWTMSQLAHYRVLLMSEKAQKLLNATMLKNPYVLAAVALTGLASSLIAFSKKTTAAEKAAAAFNAELKTERDALDKSFSSLAKTKAGTDDRRRAIEEINAKYGGYLQNLIDEKTSLEDLKKAQEEATAALIHDRSVKMKEDYTEEHRDNKTNASKQFYENISNVTKKLTAEQKGQFQAIVEQMVTTSSDGFNILRKAMKDVGVSYEEMDNHKFYSSWSANDFDMAVKAMYRTNGNLKKAEEEAQEIVDSYLKAITPETPAAPDPVFQNITKEVEAAKQKVKELQGALSDLRSGKTSSENYKSDIEAKEKELKAAKEALETLTGVSDKATKEAESKAEKARKEAQKIADAKLSIANAEKKANFDREQAKLDNEQVLLDTEKDSADKRIRQIELNYKKEKLIIEKYEQELIEARQSAERKAWEAAGSKGVFVTTVTDVDSEDQSIIDKRQSTNNKKQEADTQALLQSLLDQYQDYDTKRKAIEQKYNDDVAALIKMRTMENRDEVNAAIMEVRKLEKIDLSNFDFGQLQKEIDWNLIFGNLEEVSTEHLSSLKNKIEEFVSSAGDKISPEILKTIIDALKQMENEFRGRSLTGNIKGELGEYKKSAEDVSVAQKKLNDLIKEGKKGTEEYRNAEKELEAAQNRRQKTLANLSKSLNEIGKKGGEAVSAVGNVLNTIEGFGVDISEEITGALDGLDTIFSSLENIDLTKPMSIITGVTGVISGLAKTVGSIFGLGKENQAVLDAMERYMSMIGVLDTLIDKQKTLLSQMTGEAAIKQAKQTADIIRQQLDYEQEYLKNWFKSGASSNHHSMAYRVNRDQKDVLKDMGISDITQALNWDADKWNTFMTSYYASWAKLPEEVRNYAEAVIEGEEATKDLQVTLQELSTGVTFESFRDSLIDDLLDIDATAEDVAGNIEKYFQKAMINSMLKTKFDSKIKALYNQFSEANKYDNIDEKEYAELQKAKEELAKAITDERDTIAKTFGWESESSNDNTLKGAISKASQESIDLLAGQMGAGRIAWDKTAVSTDAIRQSMQAIYDIQHKGLDKMEEIRALTSEIRDINKGMAETNKKVEENTGGINSISESLKHISTHGLNLQ